MDIFNRLAVRRAVYLAAGGLAVFLSYLAVMTGTGPASVGPVSVATVAFPGLVTGFVMVAYVAWETRNVRRESKRAELLEAELVRKEIELGRVSTVDELTRLYTRREFDNSVRLEFERRRRYGRDLSLLLIDVSQAGDAAGGAGDTLAGDGRMSKTYVVAEMAAIFRRVLRANDIGGRFTPERLGLLLPETDEIRAQLVADRIRAAVRDHEILGGGADGRLRVSVCAGIVMGDDAFATPAEFAEAAETALAAALSAGHNQVVLYKRPDVDDDERAGPYSLAS